MTETTRERVGAGLMSTLAIVAASALLGTFVAWRTPGIELYTRDLLMRARGVLPAPDKIAIVAIDEPSMARFGRFPWPRSVMARAVSALSAGQPKSIAIDVLLADASVEAEDRALEEAIARAGNVVAAAQLIDAPTGGPSVWLDPLPSIAQKAAAVGHVNVLTESEGVARGLLVRAADDSGRAHYALPIETLRVGERLSPQSVIDNGRAVVVGPHVIPFSSGPAPVLIARGTAEHLPARRMPIDYIGPANSFAASTYSIADVVDGRVRPATFQGRYVLIGATAASMGDRLTSPFVHHSDAQGNQHGALMPGVEVLANALNTILSGRFYRETPDFFAFCWAALIAGATLGLMALSQGRFQALKQIAALAAVAVGIVVVAHLAFSHLLLILPVTSGVVSFASAGILGLMRRSLVASSRLDEAIAKMAGGEDLFAPPAPRNPAESIARLTGSVAAVVYSPAGDPLAVWGKPARATNSKEARPDVFFSLPLEGASKLEVTVVPVKGYRLVLLHPAGQPPAKESLRLATAVAAQAFSEGDIDNGHSPWPRGLEQKVRALSRLHTRLLDRARFVDSALRSVEDGLVIAAADGRIHFANRRAAGILGTGGRSLVGEDLLERIAACDAAPDAAARTREMLGRVMLDRVPVEREVSSRGSRPRQYVLRLAVVGDSAGFVATFSDITRQKELHKTKNDVIALVSHEMRTPLTAIQGMSEVLANYDVEPARRQEINLAINDEAKRLTRMITEYLDITRLESGATVMRPSPARVETVLERTLVLLDPVASARRIQLQRVFGADVPPIIADPDLLARALQNLISNAIKYSAEGTQITVTTRVADESVAIDVADQGYGIPEADLGRIFEKFYRVPRASDADAPGTGLGLALVREIAELHGGSVTVTSQVGVGSVFTMVLPKAGPPR